MDELADAYMENLKVQFGDAVELSDEFRWEWCLSRISTSTFYVYAYTFGQLLVLSLYQQYKAEGEAFRPRYQRSCLGRLQAPAKILAAAGIDIHSADFWQGGFDVVAGLSTSSKPANSKGLGPGVLNLSCDAQVFCASHVVKGNHVPCLESPACFRRCWMHLSSSSLS